MKTLLKNARVLTMIDENIINADIIVNDKTIDFIGDNTISESEFDKVIDCESNLLMPGFKNVHAHTAMVFARSIADDLPLEEWLYTTIFPMEANFLENDIYHLTKLGILEYISSGMTAAFDMYFQLHETIKAAHDLGFKMSFLHTPTSDLKYSEDKYLQLIDLCDKDLTNIKLGLHSVYTVCEDEIKNTAYLCDKYKVPAYTHLSESVAEVDNCIKAHGLTPLQYLNKYDFFKYGGAGFHSIYLDKKDIEIFKEKNISIVTCPCSNAKIIDGIAPLDDYMKENLNIGLGTDGPASNNSLDIFKEMYLCSVLQKLKYNDAAKGQPFDILKMVTVNSSKVIGLDDADVLKVGKKADIIMIDLQDPSMQPIHNIVKNIVYAGSKKIIKMTMINGNVLYYDNKFYINEKVEDIYNKVQEISNRLKTFRK